MYNLNEQLNKCPMAKLSTLKRVGTWYAAQFLKVHQICVKPLHSSFSLIINKNLLTHWPRQKTQVAEVCAQDSVPEP